MLGLGALAAFGTAGGLAVGQWIISDRQIVVIQPPLDLAANRDPQVIVPGATAAPPAPEGDDTATTTTTTMPIAEPNAANFLLTGADNGDCASSTDPTVGTRDSTRSDTIMVWRVNPDTDQVAVLSFPRDLYVEIPGRRDSRINAAYRPDEPQLLIDTIWQNFGIPIDHYIQVDFCAFRTLVNAVGGVAVPFEDPARDPASGLNVPEAGCVTLNGDMALAYVRSRKYQWQDDNGDWHTDGTSDFGRISRQQDFLRRMLAKVISDELYRPDTIGALIETNREYLVTDEALTPRRIIEFANALRHVDPAAIATYRVASRGINVGGAAMQEPLLGGDNMQAILAVFRGHATLAAAPDQVFETTVPEDAATTTVATSVATTEPATAGTGPATAPLPTVVAEINTEGVSPDPLETC
jgi:LCP family protein required for cell wall assembly